MIAAGFEFPDVLHYHVADQTWVRDDGDGTVTVGITALGLRLAGEFYMCRPKRPGTVVECGRALALVELAKSVVSVHAPLTGTVLAVNAAVEADPALVHRDPYGDGWLARLQPADWVAEQAQLLHGEPVAAAMAHHAWLNREAL